MYVSLTLEPPSFLIPWETSTYGLQNNSTSLADKVPSDRMLEMINSTIAKLNGEHNDRARKNDIQIADFVKDNLKSTDSLSCPSSSRGTAINRCTTVEDDLFLSESEEDPFATDGSNDSDYLPTPKRHPVYEQGLASDKSSSDSDSQNKPTTAKRNARKRQRNPNKWRRNQIKKCRNLGKKYTDWKGNVRPKRQQKNACTDCRQKCSEKLSEDERKQIFEDYWQLGDVNRQRDFIAKHVEMTEKARTRLREKNRNESCDDEKDTENGDAREMIKERKKAFSFKYMFYNRGTKVVVCKTFFLNTLGVSAQVVKTVFQKMGSTGIVAEDRRGRVCKNAKLDNFIKQSVRDHINLFETVESHYCRKNTSKRFLPSTLNISKMYGLYLEYCETHNIKPATESIYRIIFNSEFNFSSFIPKKDMCDICNKCNEGTMAEKK